MTTLIIVLKVVIALIFTFTGTSKVLFPKDILIAKGMAGLKDLDEKQIKVVGLLEVLGAFGLILPSLLNIFPVLSVLSALSLSLTMIVAGWVNYKLKLPVIPNAVIFIICILIAYWEIRYF